MGVACQFERGVHSDKQFCVDNPIVTKVPSDKLPDVRYNPIAGFYRFLNLCRALSILGPYNDKQRFTQFLRANGIIATVAGLLANPI